MYEDEGLRAPVTCLRIVKTGIHTRISVFINHALTGVLTVRDDELDDVLRLFRYGEREARHVRE